MRIISKHRDFYDGCQDPTDRLVYLRHKKIISAGDANDGPALRKIWPMLKPYHDMFGAMPGFPNDLTGVCRRRLVLFCGRIYGWYSFEANQEVDCRQTPISLASASPELILDTAQEHGLVNRWGRRPLGKKWFESQREKTPNSWREYPFNAAGWNRWVEKYQSQQVPDELFREFEAPVIQVSRDHSGPTIILNPPLKPLGFQAEVDTWATFQELDMFLGNNMARQVDPPAPISDELKAHSKGFDKHSFRTHSPGDRKARRRNR